MAGIELCKFTHGLGLYIRILPCAVAMAAKPGIAAVFPAFTKEDTIYERVKVTVKRHQNDYFKGMYMYTFILYSPFDF